MSQREAPLGWRAWFDRHRRYPGLRLRFSGIILLAGLIPLLGLGYLVRIQFTRLLRVQAMSDSRQTLLRARTYLDLYLQNISEISAFIATDTSLETVLEAPKLSVYQKVVDAEDLQTLLAVYLDQNFSIQQVTVAGNNGFSYADQFVAGNLARSLDHTRLVQRLAARGGQPTWFYVPNARALVYGQDIFYANQARPVGLLLIRVNASALNPIVLTSDVSQGSVWLTAAHNQLIAGLRGDLQPRTPLEQSAIAVVAHMPVPETTWQLWSSAPLTEASAGLASLRNDLLALFLVVLLGLLVVVLWMRSRITQPISRLIAAMDAFEGEVSALTDDASLIGELAYIQQSFQAMANRIHMLMEEIRSEKTLRADAEWRALQSQMNPHFLYNTLDSIGWMARAHQVPEVTEMVVSLSRMLKQAMLPGPSQIPLREELDYLRHYFRIQKIRLAERVELVVEVDSPLQSLLIPKFLLQPLVENAVIHGLTPKPGGGTVWISAHTVDDGVEIRVEDDGAGLAGSTEWTNPSRMEDPFRSHRVGLDNVKKRLAVVHKDQFQFRLYPRVPSGTVVEIIWAHATFSEFS